jgi:ABC-2 type transport system permease protein
MNKRAIYAIIRKDLKVVSQNKGVMLPIIMLPLILFVVLPWVVTLIPSMVNIAGVSANDLEELQGLINRMPAGFQQEMAVYADNQKIIAFLLVYLLAPFFLIIPLMVSTVIAADSLAGEKERKTMEALLYTPTSDRELFIAKLLSSWIVAVMVALAGFVLYVVMANTAAWSQMHRIFFPNVMWLVLILWVTPASAGLGLGAMVLISARAQGFQDANQTGGLVVLPVILMVFGQVSGVMYFSGTLVFLLGLVIWLLDGLLLWFGSRSFRRSRLMGA